MRLVSLAQLSRTYATAMLMHDIGAMLMRNIGAVQLMLGFRARVRVRKVVFNCSHRHSSIPRMQSNVRGHRQCNVHHTRVSTLE
jgi:hypothetical protein